MPSTCTLSKATGRPNASAARIASLWAASMPSMSKLGIGLGVAQLLRVGQNLGEFAAAFAHLGQDVVAGAVQDAGDGADAVARQALPQRLDHRDTAGDRGFERQRHAAFLGGVGKRGAMHRQQRLVGGDQRLAGGDRRPRPARGPGPRTRRSVPPPRRRRDRRPVPPDPHTNAGRSPESRDPSTGRAPKPRSPRSDARPGRSRCRHCRAASSARRRRRFPSPARATVSGRVMVRPPRTAPVRRRWIRPA